MSLRSLCAALALLLTSGCATTELDQIWQASNAPRMDSVLIIADSPRPDIRSYYETQFSHRLEEVGVKGVASTPVLPDLEPLTKEQVQAWVNEHGIDGVIVTRLEDVSLSERQIALPQEGSVYGDVGRHGPVTVDIESVETRLSTSLYEATTGRRVFRARSTTTQAVSPDNTVNSTIAALTRELAERGLIAARVEGE